MTTISLFANDQLLTVVSKPKIASGDMNSVLLHVDFDPIWDRFTKSAVFFTSNNDTVYEMILNDCECTVPHEVLAESGTLFIGIRGVASDNDAIKTSTLVKYKIDDGAPVGDGTSAEPTPDVYTQILAMLKGSGGGGGYDLNVKAVNHRGFCTEAPENTIPAYILSKKKGFKYVEADISFTKDGVPVLLHDSTIDRTSDGSGSISSLTYADVYQYDFGSWKSPAYAGTKIATFEEFIVLCKNIGLHPYIELKSNGSYTELQIKGLVDIVEAYGMKGKVSWISFSDTFLTYVKNYDSTARLGYLCSLSPSTIATAKNLQTGTNDVFLDCSSPTDDNIALCVDAGIPLEIWTINDAATIKNMNPYITGVTSDNLIAGKILYDASMTYVVPDEPVIPKATLLHNWDFTNSMTDTIGGGTAETNATQNSSGITFNSSNKYIQLLPDKVSFAGKFVEIDVASGNLNTPTAQHARIFAVCDTPYVTYSAASCFLWRYNNAVGWASYTGHGWDENLDRTEYPIDFFDGKTIRLEMTESGYVTLSYANIGSDSFTVVKTWNTSWVWKNGYLVIGGNTTNDLYNITISGVRIYEGVTE